MATGTYKHWTKDELKEFLNIWESQTPDEIAKHFGVKKWTVSTMASRFHKEGYPLTRKSVRGEINLLIREVINEAKKLKK